MCLAHGNAEPLHETLILERMKGMLEGCAYDDKGASAYSGHECSSGGGYVQFWCDQAAVVTIVNSGRSNHLIATSYYDTKSKHVMRFENQIIVSLGM